MSLIKAGGYNIYTGRSCFRQLSAYVTRSGASRKYILCDDNTLRHCMPLLVMACPELSTAHIIELENGESSKSLEICESIWETLLDDKAGSDSLLINLGGGVITDTGGFVASLYKRGIPFVHVPTTLLSMADASVGSKTAIDFRGIKNCIGNFTNPDAVFVYPGFVFSQTERQFLNGMAEIYKIALVYSKTFWDQLKKGMKLADLVTKSIELKNAIVMRDPLDRGLRKILNFGHSLGHAIEATAFNTAHELLHGEAVVAGMLLETEISQRKKFISKKLAQEISAVLLSVFGKPDIQPLQIKDILKKLGHDKKNKGGTFVFSLITGIGSAKKDVSVSAKEVQMAIEAYPRLQ